TYFCARSYSYYAM
nr:immunoglobulin heavy chain junction region [Mus musculus]